MDNLYCYDYPIGPVDPCEYPRYPGPSGATGPITVTVPVYVPPEFDHPDEFYRPI
jgi:hypothetical protein